MNRKALLIRPSKSAMQSGMQNTLTWKLRFLSDDPKFVDPTMGWIGGSDTMRQIELRFESYDEAVAYCEKHGLEWEEQETNERNFKPKSYANNFAFDRRRYSDIAAKKKIRL